MDIHLDIYLCFHLIFKNQPQSSIILISIDKVSRHIWSLSSGDYYQNTKNIREHSYFSLESQGSIGYSLHSCMSSDWSFCLSVHSFHTCKPRGLGVTVTGFLKVWFSAQVQTVQFWSWQVQMPKERAFENIQYNLTE